MTLLKVGLYILLAFAEVVCVTVFVLYFAKGMQAVAEAWREWPAADSKNKGSCIGKAIGHLVTAVADVGIMLVLAGCMEMVGGL